MHDRSPHLNTDPNSLYIIIVRHMKNCGIDPSQWQELATKRLDWRTLIATTVQAFEVHQSKARLPAAINYTDKNGVLSCQQCGCTF